MVKTMTVTMFLLHLFLLSAQTPDTRAESQPKYNAFRQTGQEVDGFFERARSKISYSWFKCREHFSLMFTAVGDKSKYAKDAKIIHIDIDNAEIDKNIPSTLGINCDAKIALQMMLEQLNPLKHDEWQQEVRRLKQYEHDNAAKCLGKLTPYRIIDCVGALTQADTPIVTDVGQHQMWVAQHYPFKTARSFISSCGLGTMGFGMGAAIGASIATGKRAVLFTGDGSFGMNLNELATAVSQKVPLVILILNNGVLGMVRQWQTMFYNKHYSNTTLDRKTDFPALAKAFGAVGLSADDETSLKEALKQAFATDGTVLIDCKIDDDERVLPMIPPGGAIDDLILK